jgi:hypothetical protein
MINCFQFCFNLAFKFTSRRYTMAPLLRAAVFVLVGDPHQLPPLVASRAAAEVGRCSLTLSNPR